jgi:hypothetical protein
LYEEYTWGVISVSQEYVNNDNLDYNAGLGLYFSAFGHLMLAEGLGVGADVGFNSAGWYAKDGGSTPDRQAPAFLHVYADVKISTPLGTDLFAELHGGGGVVFYIYDADLDDSSASVNSKIGFGFKGGLRLGWTLSDNLGAGLSVNIHYIKSTSPITVGGTTLEDSEYLITMFSMPVSLFLELGL